MGKPDEFPTVLSLPDLSARAGEVLEQRAALELPGLLEARGGARLALGRLLLGAGQRRLRSVRGLWRRLGQIPGNRQFFPGQCAASTEVDETLRTVVGELLGVL